MHPQPKSDRAPTPPDYIRPIDVGMTPDEFRRHFWWATEYGPRSDPYWSREEIEQQA